MIFNELKDFLETMNYVQGERNTFSKMYNILDNEINSPTNRLTITYVVNKQLVNVYHTTHRGKAKVYKAKLKNLYTANGELHGLKSTKGE